MIPPLLLFDKGSQMTEARSARAGIFKACVVAGPVFLWATTLAFAHLALPKPVEASAENLSALIIVTLPAVPVGSFLALIPAAMGTFVMLQIGNHAEAARRPAIWTLAGGAAGGAIAYLFGALPAHPELSFGLVATGAVCARICRTHASWC